MDLYFISGPHRRLINPIAIIEVNDMSGKVMVTTKLAG